MDYETRILHVGFVTHDVVQLVTTRPPDLHYEPGQGVELALNLDGWRDEGRPFTPTGHPAGPALEFTIKGYFGRDGVTEMIHRAEPGAGLLMSEPFGTITDRGPGTFIAAGAGVTPFLAILRDRARREDLAGCALHFSNKTSADVIQEKELRYLLGDRCHLTLTRERDPSYLEGRIDRAYLDRWNGRPDGPFYVCGPPDFVTEIQNALSAIGVAQEDIVTEE